MTLPVNVIDEAGYGSAFENVPHEELTIMTGRYDHVGVTWMGFKHVQFVGMASHYFVKFASDSIPDFNLKQNIRHFGIFFF